MVDEWVQSLMKSLHSLVASLLLILHPPWGHPKDPCLLESLHPCDAANLSSTVDDTERLTSKSQNFLVARPHFVSLPSCVAVYVACSRIFMRFVNLPLRVDHECMNKCGKNVGKVWLSQEVGFWFGVDQCWTGIVYFLLPSGDWASIMRISYLFVGCGYG